MTILQPSIKLGEMALPNALLYHHAAILIALIQWWNPNNKSIWYAEQYGIPTPLTELMMHEAESCTCPHKTRNYIGAFILEK